MKPYRLKYRQQIFLWFFVAFACFTTGIVLFQQRWERNIKIENLKNNLDGYAAIVHRYIQERNLTFDAETPEQMTDVLNLLPPNMRITVINQDGELLFDNQLADIENVENHLKRTEIQQALQNGSGSDIRLSQSMNMKFFYLARAYDRYYIRVALPYNIEAKNIIRSDNWFLYFTSVLFLTVLILLVFISGRLGKAITANYRQLKHEMTSNIAHELRTPVSSIRGYLETMLEQENIDIQKQRSFLERSYQQTLKLSELIRDIALITKIEEAPHLFLEETVNISSVLQELKEEFEIPFHANDIVFEDNISPEIAVTSNRTLIYSLFRNLIENVVRYAGKGVVITIDMYNESTTRYSFSFSDTGKGVAEEHLSKMFDRFYRLDEGRTRNSGGSGLGLAIVKNAVQFHQGDIIAKNRKDGGLEFLFTLKK